MVLAREIKTLVDNAPTIRSKILQLNNPHQLFMVSSPDCRLSDLVVSDNLYERIKRIIDEFISSKKLRKHGLANRRKILLEGNSGTGKTLTASVVASELGLSLFAVQVDKLVTKFMGETSAKLRQIFDSIESVAGVYL
ncbi:hypothetical protein FACS1894204_12710 [Synergistales bacterium]|nr:hypothetical protein FACS1894204_12710 [Synergistales bacterium]